MEVFKNHLGGGWWGGTQDRMQNTCRRQAQNLTVLQTYETVLKEEGGGKGVGLNNFENRVCKIKGKRNYAQHCTLVDLVFFPCGYGLTMDTTIHVYQN